MSQRVWWIEREFLDRNLVVIGVQPSVKILEGTQLTDAGLKVAADIRNSLFVEDYFGGLVDPNRPHELHFQYPTQKVIVSGSVVRVAIPAGMLKSRRDYVTIKKNEDGTILIVP